MLGCVCVCVCWWVGGCVSSVCWETAATVCKREGLWPRVQRGHWGGRVQRGAVEGRGQGKDCSSKHVLHQEGQEGDEEREEGGGRGRVGDYNHHQLRVRL